MAIPGWERKELKPKNKLGISNPLSHKGRGEGSS